jgi:hypothetical protein
MKSPCNCGSCEWFEPAAQAPPNGQPQNGECWFNPPVPVLVQGLRPGSTLSPSGPQVQPMAASISPPTTVLRRCASWMARGNMRPQ